MDKTDTTNNDMLVQLDNEFLLKVAQTLNIGVAIVEVDTWVIVFENANFFKWFPPDANADVPLSGRLPRLKIDRVQRRLQAGRPFTYEVESPSGERETPIAVQIRTLGDPFEDLLVVECQDITKQRQSEYMLEFILKNGGKKCP